MSEARVLFVDDEPNVLAGLRRMLYPQAQQGWTMHFADSGEEALALMAAEPIDVIVSDMRMPGMDGAALLAAVREHYPATARLVLSGHADLGAIIAGIGPAQQFLAKPCEADRLINAVTRMLGAQALITDDRLRRVVGEIESLPKPPALYQDMCALVADPDIGLAEVAELVQSDLATTTEVLKLVNSAFFGLPREVDSVTRAVSLLGMSTIQALTLAGAVFQSGSRLPAGLDVAALRDQGLRVATLAQGLAVAEGWPKDAQNHTFLAGLLHDVGVLVLAANNHAGYQALVSSPAEAEPLNHGGLFGGRREAELAAFGCTVVEAGAYLLGLWGFAEPVVQAVAAQPCHEDADAAGISQAIWFAACRAERPTEPMPESQGSYLDGDRTARWNQECDERLARWGSGHSAR